jgi:hypothetical protein
MNLLFNNGKIQQSIDAKRTLAILEGTKSLVDHTDYHHASLGRDLDHFWTE